MGRAVTGGLLTVYAVASPYAWDVVESARRAGFDPVCVDNHGGADERLPGLTSEPPRRPFVLGLSAPRHRAEAARRAHEAGLVTPLALHDPSAVVASTCTIGHGSYLNAGVVVASHSRVGCHANLNRSASVGHDNLIGFAASVGPGAVTTGGVVIDALAFVGAGAVVLPGVRIGRGATVGAGAVVTKDVADFATVAGNPARPLGSARPAELHVGREGEEGDRCPHCLSA